MPVAAKSGHFQLVAVPHLINRLNIMLIHRKDPPVLLRTLMADKRTISDIRMSTLVLLTIDAKSIELIPFNNIL